METYQWLPYGYVMDENLIIRQRQARGMQWQLYQTQRNQQVLAVLPDLLSKWRDMGLIDTTQFSPVAVQKGTVMAFCAKVGKLISSVALGPFTRDAVQAQGFATTLRQMRSEHPDIPLNDAIYISQLSKLLPTFEEEKVMDDRLVLGRWLCAGAPFSVRDYKKLSSHLSWLPSFWLEDIIEEAGLSPLGTRQLYRSADEEREPAAVNGSQRKNRNGSFCLPGRPELESFFQEHIIDILDNQTEYARMGIGFPGAIVLHGAPGSGKTFAVEKLVEYLGWPLYSVDSQSIASSYIHETSRKISEVFEEAIENAPSVLVIDEMEAYLSGRSYGLASGVHHIEEVSEFLRRIPQAHTHHVLVIAMTNMLDTIDPAILRRGRFDHILEVKLPTMREVLDLLQSLLSNKPVAKDVDLNNLARQLEEHPLSDVAFVVNEAGRLAVKEKKAEIDSRCFSLALSSLAGKETDGHQRIGY